MPLSPNSYDMVRANTEVSTTLTAKFVSFLGKTVQMLAQLSAANLVYFSFTTYTMEERDIIV